MSMIVPVQRPAFGQFIESDPEQSPKKIVPAIELPVYGMRPADRKWVNERILGELDNGQFLNSGIQGDAILRNARIRGAYEQRLAGLFAAPLELLAADDNAECEKIAEDVHDRWGKLFPRPALEELQRYGITQGIGIAEKVWDTSTKPWTFALKVYSPRYYTWIWSDQSYYLTTYTGFIRIPRRSRQWLVYTPYGYERAFLFGNIRSLLDPFMFMSWNANDWGNYNEIYGRPIRQAVVPQQSNPADEKKFVDSISKMGAGTVIKAKQDKDGNAYKVELVEARSTGWKTFEQALRWAREEVAEVLLGQTMSMDGKGGLGATEEPGKAVRADIRSSDNEKLTECLKEQGVEDYVEFAYGDRALAPQPSYLVEPKDDDSKKAKAESDRAVASSTRIMAKITTPAEEAIALGEGKGIEEVIDVAQRRQLQATHAEQMLLEGQNALDSAKDPEPTPGQKNEQNQKQAEQQAKQQSKPSGNGTATLDDVRQLVLSLQASREPNEIERLKMASDVLVNCRLSATAIDPADVMRAAGVKTSAEPDEDVRQSAQLQALHAQALTQQAQREPSELERLKMASDVLVNCRLSATAIDPAEVMRTAGVTTSAKKEQP